MDEFAQYGVVVTHGYFKRSWIPALLILEQHAHKSDHISVLVLGAVCVTVDGESTRYDAPAEILIKAGKKHMVSAITDVIWYCNHEMTEAADPIDKVLIE